MASWLFYIAVFEAILSVPKRQYWDRRSFAAACVMTFYGAWKNRTKLFYREDLPWGVFSSLLLSLMESTLSGLPIGNSRCIRRIGFIPRVRYGCFGRYIQMALCVVCAGFAASICYFSCLFCSLGVGVISMNPGAVPGLWELSMIRTSLHFYLYHDAGTFMGYRRKAIYTVKTRIGFWGMFLLGSVFDRKRQNQRGCLSGCL